MAAPTSRNSIAVLAVIGAAVLLIGAGARYYCSSASPAIPGLDLTAISGVSGKLWKAKRERAWRGGSITRRRKVDPAAPWRPDVTAEVARCTCGGGAAWRPGGGTISCARWAVITTIFEPTDLVKQLSKLKGWCAVVAGDKKGPPEGSYNLPNVVFLDVQAQEALGYKVTSNLRWNHFGRKNMGFLFAIQHGAQWVFDCDDDNPMKVGPQGAVAPPLANWEQETVPAVDKSDELWNPYPFYNRTNFMWPRGFPLDRINALATQRNPSGIEERWSSVAVLQSLADNDPDVDAIYRLTRSLPHFFGRVPSAVALPTGVMAPYNAQACLFRRDALWSMFLPVTVHGRVSDIWRSYFTQRVLWWAGLRAAFAAPFVTQYRNAHNYLADFQSEIPLYLRAGELVRRLSDWSPSPGALDAGDAMLELIVDMYEHGVVEREDVIATQAWVQDLDSMGYAFPKKQVD